MPRRASGIRIADKLANQGVARGPEKENRAAKQRDQS